jgi:ribosomal protein L37AE/L43A
MFTFLMAGCFFKWLGVGDKGGSGDELSAVVLSGLLVMAGVVFSQLCRGYVTVGGVRFTGRFDTDVFGGSLTVRFQSIVDLVDRGQCESVEDSRTVFRLQFTIKRCQSCGSFKKSVNPPHKCSSNTDSDQNEN